MELLYNNTIINEIVTKLFRHRRNDYSQIHAETVAASLDIRHDILPIANRKYEKLMVSLFYAQPIEKIKICLLFLHGYGSNRLQCSNLLPFLASNNLALCSLDFSGSGKSQGDTVTYGIKEKQDIDCTLSCLRKMGFQKFILWGRSMGATSALLYSLNYEPADVILQVVDSPFYSFEMIAFQIASKNVKAPQFMVSFGLEMAKKNCAKFEFNPFAISLENVGKCKVPALFVYCEEDSVINSCNTQFICQRYKGTFQKLVITQNHNTIRSQETLTKIFNCMAKYLKQPFKDQLNLHKSKSMQFESILSKQDQGQQRKNGTKKGIRRVQSIQQDCSHKFDDYGIWVASKIQQSLPEKKKVSGIKKIQISLNSSIERKDVLESVRKKGVIIYSQKSLRERKGELWSSRHSCMSGNLTNSRYL